MAVAVWRTPATTNPTVQVPASAYFGLSASTAVTLFTGGAVPYQVYEPSSTAIAAMGWTGLPYRLHMYIATLSSQFTGTPATNVGAGATDNYAVLPAKLGYGTANDGSFQSADQNWPTLVVVVQGPTTWFPVISGASTRGWFMIMNAVYAAMMANYNIDPNFVTASGCSGGAGVLMEYAMAADRWPTRYPLRFAAITTIGGSFSGSGTRQDWPEAIPGENSVNQTFPRLSKQMARMPLPWWEVLSVNDEQNTPTIYNNWVLNLDIFSPAGAGDPIPAGQSAGVLKRHGKYHRVQIYTGASAPKHASIFASGGSVFDYFYGNNAVGGGGALLPTDPWATWLFQQRLKPAQRSSARNTVYSYAGGSNGPTPPDPAATRVFVRDRQGSRRGRFI